MTHKMTYRHGRNIREHRAIMEEHLGRKLLPEELVHHKDGDKRNNNILNLEITTRSEHAKMHPDNLMARIRPVTQKDKNGQKIKTWESATDVQRQLGFRKSNICKCCKQIIGSAYGFVWEYGDVGIK